MEFLVDNIGTISIVLGMAYFFLAMYLLSQTHPKASEPGRLPQTSVLIAMRNEAENIEACLQSLTKQDYPQHLYDIHILDDRSDDDSYQIASKFAEQNENFHLHKISEDLNGLQGKMNALAQGIKKTDAEIILITDADCIVPKSWIRRQVSYFDEEAGMVGGLTALYPTDAISISANNTFLFGKIQALDWLFLQTIAAGSSAAGLPITILGNNFGFRKSAYQDCGGFEQIGFSVTEDYALMKSIVKNTDWKIRHTIDPLNTIFSQPVKSVTKFLKQRKRWTQGGRSARPWAYFIVGISVLAHLMVLTVFALKVWQPITALGIGLVIGTDYFVMKRSTSIKGLEKLRKYFLLFEVFYILYLIIFSIWSFIPQRIRWKGRSL